MEIEIIKKEDGEIIFKIDGEENKFEYEYFDKLIETVYENDEKINFKAAEELKEYEELLKGIIEGARTEDYREAINKAKQAKDNLIEAEKENVEKVD